MHHLSIAKPCERDLQMTAWKVSFTNPFLCSFVMIMRCISKPLLSNAL